MRRALAVIALAALSSCSDPLAPVGHARYTHNGIVLDALSVQRGVNQTGEVWLYVQMYNPTDAGVTVTLPGACMLRPRLYRSYTHDLVWDGIAADPHCGDEWREYRIGPKQTLPVVWEYVLIRSHLGDAVKTGTYNLTAALRPEGPLGPVIEVRAGVVRF
jgi:hypothetical protein